MTDVRRPLDIERLGQRGEGIARVDGETVYVAYALAGETVLAEVHGERGDLIDVLRPSPDRVPAICKHYGICGGCAVQALAPAPYAEWKRGLVVTALKHARVETLVGALIDAHGQGRRRATFHVRYPSRDVAHVGFMKARAHEIVDLDACPILAPQMTGALGAARAIAGVLASQSKPLDILVTATATGLDIDIKGHGPIRQKDIDALVAVAEAHDLARLSNHGLLIIERRAPILRMGRTAVAAPPGVFLQATEAGEAALAHSVVGALAGVRRGLDLFAGVGTFSLRLAEFAQIHAIDSDGAALSALARAAREAQGLRPVTTESRDLFRRPIAGDELSVCDGVVFDPPRAGAEAQAQALAESSVPLIAAVSCNPATFARDLAILTAGGYTVDSVTPIDQFRYSPHVEIVGILRRAGKKSRAPRRLLG